MYQNVRSFAVYALPSQSRSPCCSRCTSAKGRTLLARSETERGCAEDISPRARGRALATRGSRAWPRRFATGGALLPLRHGATPAQGSNAGRHSSGRRVEARGGVFVLWCTCSSRRSDVRDVQIRCCTVVARPSPARKSERYPAVHTRVHFYMYIQLNMVPHPGLRILAISRPGTTNNVKDPIFGARSVKQRAVKRGPNTTGPILTTPKAIARL